MKSDYASEDLSFIARITCIMMATVLLMCWPLYLPGERIYAPYPVMTCLMSLPERMIRYLYFLNFLPLVWLFIAPRSRAPAMAALAFLCFWVLQDINRFSACIYMLGFTLTVLAWGTRHTEASLQALRIMVIGVYFWAGFYKANSHFWFSTGPWFFSPLHIFGQYSEVTIKDYCFAIAIFITPFFESLIGIFLIFKTFRMLASCMAFIMLVIALVCLGPWGLNVDHLAWPWNVQLFLLELRLFTTGDFNKPSLPSGYVKWKICCIVSTLLFIAMPCLAIIFPWYEKMGFKLYTGSRMDAYILLSSYEPVATLPPTIAYATHNHVLNIKDWVKEELHANFFSSESALKTGAVALCPHLQYPHDAMLEIAYPPFFNNSKRRTSISPLCQ